MHPIVLQHTNLLGLSHTNAEVTHPPHCEEMFPLFLSSLSILYFSTIYLSTSSLLGSSPTTTSVFLPIFESHILTKSLGLRRCVRLIPVFLRPNLSDIGPENKVWGSQSHNPSWEVM